MRTVAATQIAPKKLLERIGDYRRKGATNNALAQAYFDQGLALLYAFHKHASQGAFAEAARLDPDCALAWWGQAMALGPDINAPVVDQAASRASLEYLSKAQKAAKDPMEVGLVEAAIQRYADPAPEKRGPLDLAYADAMGALWKRFSEDPDIGSLYAEALLTLNPWDNYLPSGAPRPETRRAIEILQQVLRISPKHLMANHMLIHAVEASTQPEQGATAAETLRKLNLSLGHLVHMPSHIDVRLGNWTQAIAANEKAISKDNATTLHQAIAPTYLPYLAHNRMMLAYAATMKGGYRKATAAMEDFQKLIPADQLKDLAPLLDGYMGAPLDVRRRFGKWNAILKAPPLPEFLPLATANRHANRAIAFAALKRPEDATTEFQNFLAARKNVEATAVVGNTPARLILDIEEQLTRGELAIQAGDFKNGLGALRTAVTLEDQTRYDEPPDWMQPVRHTLGAALLRAGRPSEAVTTYQEDLKRHPNNGWSLLGLSQAYGKLGQAKLATKYASAYRSVWSKDDPPATSSCLCLPALKPR